VWNDVAAELTGRYRIARYDVRGAGESERPKRRSAYRLDQLADDLVAVLDAVSPQRPVHLVGHDWGSIQGWHAVMSGRVDGRVSSYTSISGPDLDHAVRWLRSQLRPDRTALGHATRQLIDSAYIPLFCTPRVPEVLWQRGILDAGLPSRHRMTRLRADEIDGLQLYRANMLRGRVRAGEQHTAIPVQVLAPTRDRYVTPALQTEAPRRYVARLHVEHLDGGHWIMLTQPALVAAHLAAFAAAQAG
jgi:pimeloyl-ACP methyl ester carboxylesterase